MAKRTPVEKPFGGGLYTKAGFFSFIRSALRQKSRRWAPIYQCLNEARRPNKSKNLRLKWEFSCSMCRKWFPQTSVEVDHLIPAGSLKDFEDLPRFVRNLFCEKEHLRVLCNGCHKKVTDKERINKDIKT